MRGLLLNKSFEMIENGKYITLELKKVHPRAL